MQNERLVATYGLHSFRAGFRSVIRGDVFLEVRNILAGPLSLILIPPHELLALTPRLAVRTRRCAVVENAPVRRPGKSPPVAEIVVRLAHVGDIVSRFRMDTGVDPTAAGGAAVVLQLGVFADEVSGVRAIAVDLANHGINLRLANRALGRIVPGERLQAGIAFSTGTFDLVLHAAAKVIHEPGFAAAIAGRLDR